MNLRFLEASLLLILLLNFLRINLVTNNFVLLFLAFLYCGFLATSLGTGSRKFLVNLRVGLFWAIIAISFTFVAFQQESKGIHDGVVLTKAATGEFLSGQNPYAVFYESAFYGVSFKPLPVEYSHYMYSPMMFVANIPANLVLSGWYKGNEFLITLIVFLVGGAIAGAYLVREKLLFLILFLLNPVFVPLTFYGANEVIILFFLIACMAALSSRRFSLATFLLALATGTKLLAAPFVPIYFIYLWLLSNKLLSPPPIKTARPNSDQNRLNITGLTYASARQSLKGKSKSDSGLASSYFLRWLPSQLSNLKGSGKAGLIVRQMGIFALVTLLIYLPFFVWGPRDLIDDVVFYHLRGGEESHVIAGFLGIPAVLNSLGIVSATSRFPFFIFQIMIAFAALPFLKRVIEKSLSIQTLCISYFFYFCTLFVFSRIIQTSFIAFLSELLIFASFVRKSR